MKYHINTQTDIGLVRASNEDNLCINGKYMRLSDNGKWSGRGTVKECVLAVCDGMGGEEFGEFASLCAVSNIAASYNNILEVDTRAQKGLVDDIVKLINQQICEEMQNRGVRIGSTIAMLCIKNGYANIYNIGDSRIYLLRNSILTRLSKDHTLTQQKLDLGAISEEQAEQDSGKHSLTQHLGVFETEMIIEAHHVEKLILPGDIFLLCSDGLTDMVDEGSIQEILNNEESRGFAAENLVTAALKNGGKDNVTAMTVQCEKKWLF